MEYQDIKNMTDKELHLTLRDERAQLQKVRFSHAVSPVENPHKIRIARKTIARFLTEINRRRVESSNA
ncbi:MAG: 50S ribosomal protein L29 [Bacteroidia bacterium]|nr:50S ribosomal protein L29 [Bacteroidia bacterium]NNJ56329.1 50S ribosomal protein L29 [Bacteroidia bacterium]